MKKKINRSVFEKNLRAVYGTLECVANKNDPRQGTWYYYADVMVPGENRLRTSGYDPKFTYVIPKRVLVATWIHGFGEMV